MKQLISEVDQGRLDRRDQTLAMSRVIRAIRDLGLTCGTPSAAMTDVAAYFSAWQPGATNLSIEFEVFPTSNTIDAGLFRDNHIYYTVRLHTGSRSRSIVKPLPGTSSDWLITNWPEDVLGPGPNKVPGLLTLPFGEVKFSSHLVLIEPWMKEVVETFRPYAMSDERDLRNDLKGLLGESDQESTLKAMLAAIEELKLPDIKAYFSSPTLVSERGVERVVIRFQNPWWEADIMVFQEKFRFTLWRMESPFWRLIPDFLGRSWSDDYGPRPDINDLPLTATVEQARAWAKDAIGKVASAHVRASGVESYVDELRGLLGEPDK